MKLRFLFAILALSILSVCLPASAAHQLPSSNGNVIVDVLDELGNPITGAQVQLRVPGTLTPDAIYDASDMIFTMTDGVDDDDGFGADGDVEFNSGGNGFGGNILNTKPFEIKVDKAGYVQYTKYPFGAGASYSYAGANDVSSANLFTVKVIMKRQLPFDTALLTATAAVTGGLTVTDGVAGQDGNYTPADADNGTIYVAQDPSGLGVGPHTVTASKSGFLTSTDSTKTISSGYQSVYTFNFDYPFVISAQDELGFDVTLTTTVNPTGLTFVESNTNAGDLYLAATAGPSQITISEPGYIQAVSTGGPYTYNAAGAQTPVNFQAAGQGPALEYSLRVLGVTDELDNVLALPATPPGTPFSATGFSIVGQRVSVGVGYVAATTGTVGTLIVSVSGYVNSSVSVTPSSLSQTTVDFDLGDPGSYAAAVDGPPMPYTVKLAAVEEELGNALALGGGDTFKLYTDSGCTVEATYISAPAFSGASWYVAVADGSYYGQYAQTGYVATCDATTVAAAQAGPQASPSFDGPGADGLKYAARINLSDELGIAVAGVVVTDVTIGGANADRVSANSLYYALAAAGIAAGGHTGFINIDTVVDTQLASVTPGVAAQTVVNLTGVAACATGGSVAAGATVTCNGLDFAVKVAVSDELGNAIAGMVVGDITIGGGAATRVSGSTLYYALAAAGIMAGGKTGYVSVDTAVDTQLASVNPGVAAQTVVNLTGVAACAAGGSVAAGATVTCNGLDFAVKVAVSDELGIAVAGMAVGDITIGGSGASQVSGNTLYYALAAAGIMAGGKSGYVNVNTAVDTQLTSVNPGVAAQTVVNLAWAVACAAGGSVAAGATVTCNGLDYVVKLTVVEEELGNALVLGGGDTFKLYTDSGCTAEAAYISAPAFSGASWYVAVANGSYYGKYGQTGYVATCDLTTVAAAQAGPQVGPSFDGPGADGLKYAARINLSDELGIAVAGVVVTDVTIGGANADRVSANSLYYALAAAGIAAGGHTGFINIDTVVDTQLASVTPGVTGQTVVNLTGVAACAAGGSVAAGATVTCNGLDFTVKVAVSDELGNAITGMVVGDITIGGGAATQVSGSTLYYALAAAGIVAGGKSGYVNVNTAVDTQLTSVNPGVAGQTVVNLTGVAACAAGGSVAAGATVTCNGLDFAVKVSVSDELGIAVAGMAVGDVTIGGNGASRVSGNTLYYALAAAGIMAGGKSGYVNVNTAVDTQLTSVNPGVAAQTVVNLAWAVACAAGGSVAAGATVTCNGLDYTVMLNAVQEELGNALVLAGGDTFKLYTDSGCTAEASYIAGPTFSGAAWYVAVANGSYYGKYGQTGYVSKCDLTSVAAAQAGPQVSPSFVGAAGDGLLYAVKVNVSDELGNAIAGVLVTDITIGGGAATRASGSALYYALAAAGAMANSPSGYLNINTAVDTQLASVTPGVAAQTVVNLTGVAACATGGSVAAGATVTCNGLDFAVKVAVSDELGNAITGMVVGDITIGGGAATQVSGNTLYYALAAAGIMAGGKSGYVSVNTAVDTQLTNVNPGVAAQTVVNLTGVAACAVGGAVAAGATVTCNGLDFAVKVSVSDELGTAVAGMAVGDITIGGSGASRVSGNTLYYALAAAGIMAGGKSGYVNVNTAVDTQLTSVNPGVAAQTVVNLTGAVACAAGGSVAAGATVTCNGLDYTVMLNTVQEELGNALVLAGVDTFKLYTNSGCTTEASYIAGPAFSGAAWYVAVANGSYYGKYGQTGYVSKCDLTSVAAAQAGPQVSPSFVGAAGDGLPYAVKVNVSDELGNAIAGVLVTDITIGGGAATQASGSALYYALAAAGAMANSPSGYVNVNTAVDTQLASVTPGVAAQTVVSLTGVAACAAGGSVAAGATVTCNGLDFAVKVSVSDELGNAIAGMVVGDITIGGGAATQVSGSTLYYALAAAGIVAGGKSGYVSVNTAVDTQLTSVNPGVAGQTVVNLTGVAACAAGGAVAAGATVTCNGLDFAVKVAVSDELGNAITGMVVGDITIGGGAATQVSGSTLYYALAAAGIMAGGKSGYVSVDTAVDTQLASVNPGVAAQTVVNLTGVAACAAGGNVAAGATVTCNGLDFAVKVAVSDELGIAVAGMVVGDITIGGSGASQVSGNTLYYALAAAGIMAGGKSGYVNVNTAVDTQLASVNPGVAAQTVVNLTGAVACAAGGSVAAGATVTCNGLDFVVKLSAVEEELGNALVLAGGDTFKLYTDSGCTAEAAYISAPAFSGASWYVAVANGSYYGKYGKTGYVATCDLTSVAAAQAGPQVGPSFDGPGADGLKYAARINLSDELGIAVAGVVVTDVTIGGANADRVSANSLYYALAAAGIAAGGHTGFINIDTVVDTQLASVTPGVTGQTVVNLTGVAACAAGGSVAAGATVTCNGLDFAVKVAVSDELGTAVAGMVVGDITIGGGAATQVSGNTLYYALAAAGIMAGGKSGYVNVNTAADTQLASVNPGVAAQTVVNLTGVAACAAGGNVAAGATVTCNGLDFVVKLTAAQDELGNALVLTGGDTFKLYTDSGCTAEATYLGGPTFSGAAWYVAVANGSYYGKYGQTGYVATCDLTSVAAAQAGPQAGPSFVDAAGDGLLFQIRVNPGVGGLETEIGAPLTMDGTETLTVCTAADCGTTEAPAAMQFDAVTGAWYIAPASTGNKWMKIRYTGFVDTIDTLAIAAATTAQVIPAWVGADGDGLMYMIKVTSVDDEIGDTVTLEAADSVLVFSSNVSGVCTGAQAMIVGPDFDATTGAWYIGMADGDYYIRYRKDGYVDACDLTAVTASETGPQAIPTFESSVGDALRYGLKVRVEDEFGRPVTNVTVTHGVASPARADMGPENNIYYFDTSGAAGLKLEKTGYRTIDPAVDPNSVEPGGYAIGQTFIDLTGNNGAIGIVTATVPGTYKLADGLEFLNNVELTVEYATSSLIVTEGVAGLGSLSNFYFIDATEQRVFPETFIETDPINNPGVYQFKVDISAVTVQVKDVDYDADPWADFVDSDPVPLVGLTEDSLTAYGPVVLTPAADYAILTQENELVAGATAAIKVTVYDNEGATVSIGAHAAFGVEVSLGGGAVSPPSEKDIADTTLALHSDISGASDTDVTGNVAVGTATVVITDNIITDGYPILASVSAFNGFLPQNAQTNTTDLNIDVVKGIAAAIVVLDPTDVTTDATATVSFEIQDAQGNVIDDSSPVIRVTLTGPGGGSTNAVIADTIVGSFVNPLFEKGTSSAQINVPNGRATIAVRDSVAETVIITVVSPDLDDSSTQDLIFSPGAPAQVILSNPVPTTQTVGQNVTITCQIQDAGGNLVTGSLDIFTVKATANINTPKFNSVTVGEIISGLDTNQVVVRASGGTVTITLTDDTYQNVLISLEDSAGVGFDVSSQQTALFTPGNANKLVIIYNEADLTMTAGAAPKRYDAQVQDTNGNIVDNWPADITVNLASGHSATGVFSATFSGPAVSSVVIPANNFQTPFYYTDTLAGTALITVSATGLASDSITVTVQPEAPVDEADYSASFTTENFTDSEQPTLQSTRQKITPEGGVMTLLEFPWTDTSAINQIVADGYTRGVIRVKVKDKYGNPIAGEPITFTTSGLSGVTVDPSGAVTDSSGEVNAGITSAAIGSTQVTVDLDDRTYQYGQTFTVRFKSDDRTPPTVSRYDSSTLVDGDYVDPDGPINIRVALADEGDNAVGLQLDEQHILVSVVLDGNDDPIDGSVSLAGCAAETDCIVAWTPDFPLDPGTYEITLTVMDLNMNEQTITWRVVVAGGTVLKDLICGPSIFDPRTGGQMEISFQLPRDGASVSIEIYNRSGRLVYQDRLLSAETAAGYNRFLWNGRDISGGILGNGIYMFRITASYGGQITSRTGKFAIVKR